ncbi:hypothetical protein PSTG_16706 [Puccinia striiformis f. sp. tritici PST-78]|uniref:Uncharacterized protein n=1 Tax=Puccinia striiformis f. sp. tritici PST-78 TaxID=1165861 RepID=A0A0L0USE1_9BASI|nr:hypothetical protein PSTG_16706 [Puccinia striiformis f. sp. tritici PST-78]
MRWGSIPSFFGLSALIVVYQAMDGWVSRNHMQLSEAWADDDIDFSELDQYLRGQISLPLSSAEPSHQKPPATSVSIPAKFCPDSSNDANTRRRGQHMKSPVSHRGIHTGVSDSLFKQKTYSHKNDDILGKASEAIVTPSANMGHSGKDTPEQVMSPPRETWYFTNKDMGLTPNDSFDFSGNELSSHFHTPHIKLATNPQMNHLPAAVGPQTNDQLDPMDDQIGLQQKITIYREAPKSIKAARENSLLIIDPVWPSGVETSCAHCKDDVIDTRKFQQPLDLTQSDDMFPSSIRGPHIHPNCWEEYIALLADSGENLIESRMNMQIFRTSHPTMIAHNLNGEQEQKSQNHSPIVTICNHTPQEPNMPNIFFKRKIDTNLGCSLNPKRKQGSYVPYSIHSDFLHTVSSEEQTYLLNNPSKSTIQEVEPKEMFMEVRTPTSYKPRPQETSNHICISLGSTGKKAKCELPRLIFDLKKLDSPNISPEHLARLKKMIHLIDPLHGGKIQMKLREMMGVVSGGKRKSTVVRTGELSSSTKKAMWTQGKKVFYDNVHIWLKYWEDQTGNNFKTFSTEHLPSSYRKIFPMFLFYVEMIITIVKDPKEGHLEYVQKLRKASECFAQLAARTDGEHFKKHDKQSVENRRALLETQIRRGKGSQYGFLWVCLDFWLAEEDSNLWPDEEVVLVKFDNHCKGLFNSIFSFSIINLTEHYAVLINGNPGLVYPILS